jgi:hypothetical protein
MAAEAYPVNVTTAWERGRLVLAAAVEPGDVLQYHDGRACVVESVKDLAIGDEAGVIIQGGDVEVPLTTNVALVKGAPYWWDESANAVIACPGLNVGDFYLGTAAEDKVGGTGVRGKIRLNAKPEFAWSLKDGGSTGAGDKLVETLGLGVRFLSGSSARLEFDAVSEAATAYVLSSDALPTADKFLFHAIVNVVANGDASAFDAVIGIANDGHATNPDTIAQSAFVSINGADTKLYGESDDDSTEVAATDTTTTFTAGTPFSVLWDKRDNAGLKLYINGIRRLSATEFVLSAAGGPLKALAMMEKTANDTAAVIVVLQMGLIRSDDAA